MTAEERGKLERSCRMCREAGMSGDQLLLIRLDDVEEYLKLEKIVKDILEAIDTLEAMRNAMKYVGSNAECPEKEVDAENENSKEAGIT